MNHIWSTVASRPTRERRRSAFAVLALASATVIGATAPVRAQTAAGNPAPVVDSGAWTQTTTASPSSTPDGAASAETVSATAAVPALDVEEAAFCRTINTYRAQHGLGALRVSTALANAATWHTNDMAAKNYFSHTDSLGRDPVARMATFGYGYSYTGENLAVGNATADATFAQWKASAGHNQNMLTAAYKVIGISRSYSATSAYQWYWNTDFGGYTDASVPCPIAATVPSAPSWVGATAGDASATVNWSAPSNNGGSPVTGYVVTPFVGTTAGTPRSFATTTAPQVITGLANGTAYTFKVAAINAAGTGPQSAVSNSVTPRTVPT